MSAQSKFSSGSALRASLAGAFLGIAILANAATVVPGDSNPYLAGMPDGSTDGSDRAPGQSPVFVTGLNLSLGAQLTFTNAVGGKRVNVN